MQNLPDYATIYVPDDSTGIKGTVQIIHGMAEHQRRYKDFSEFLKSSGYVVATSDLRGHGDHVSINEELGYFGENGVSGMLGDIHEITFYIKERYRDLPYFILGHDIGALLAAVYLKKYDSFLNGLFLSGMPAPKSGVQVNNALLDAVSNSRGDYYRSKKMNSRINGSVSHSFRKDNSDYAYLASEPGVWKAYEADPKCGFIFTVNGFRTLLQLSEDAYKNGTWSCRRTNIPIRFMSGLKDPCIGSRYRLNKTASMFREHGYKNTDVKFFENSRHEILNDRENSSVYDYILSEMNAVSER